VDSVPAPVGRLLFLRGALEVVACEEASEDDEDPDEEDECKDESIEVADADPSFLDCPEGVLFLFLLFLLITRSCTSSSALDDGDSFCDVIGGLPDDPDRAGGGGDFLAGVLKLSFCLLSSFEGSPLE
jgi:hypothetical protein